MPFNQGRAALVGSALARKSAARGARTTDTSIVQLGHYLEAMNRGDLAEAERQLNGVEAAWDREDARRTARGQPPIHHGRPRVYRLLLLEAQGRKAAALMLAHREIAILEALQSPDDRSQLDRAFLMEYVGDLDGAVVLLDRLALGAGPSATQALSELTRIQAGLPPQL